MDHNRDLITILQQLEQIFRCDSATTLACGSMLSYEIGSQLQRHKKSWEEERTRIGNTIEHEMEKSFLISPQKAQETTLQHQQLMDSFLRDLEDRRSAVCRNSRKTFLTWLAAAAESSSTATSSTPVAAVSSTNNHISSSNTILQQSLLIPIDYGRTTSTTINNQITTTTTMKFPIFGSHPHSQEKAALTISLSPLDDLEQFLPLINQKDQPDSREAAMRAIAMLSRFVSSQYLFQQQQQQPNKNPSLSSSSSSSSVLLFFGSSSGEANYYSTTNNSTNSSTSSSVDKDFQTTCLEPIRDFIFEISPATMEQDNITINSTSLPLSQKLKKMLIMEKEKKPMSVSSSVISVKKIFPISGIWGANLGVQFSVVGNRAASHHTNTNNNNSSKLDEGNNSNNNSSRMTTNAIIQEVVDHCISMWNATMISVVFSNSLRSDEICDLSKVVCECLKITAQDSYTSQRVQTRNGVKIPAPTQNNSNSTNKNINNNNNMPILMASPLGCSVRFFVPKLKLQTVHSAMTK